MNAGITAQRPHFCISSVLFEFLQIFFFNELLCDLNFCIKYFSKL